MKVKVKVKVPKEVQIGCHKFGVFLKDKSIPSEDAVVDYRLQDIRVKDDLPSSRMNIIFIHEALHLINTVYGVRLENEEQIEVLSEGLGQLLFSNMGIELDWSDIPTKTATVKEQDK